MKPKVLIVGAGFAGIFAAKKLDQLLGEQAEITLVSPNKHFEYHASLYKILGEESPVQACIPLDLIFKNTAIRLVHDTITEFNTARKIAFGKEKDRYPFDYAILTLGSENAYPNIQGISNFSHSFRSINDAIRLSRHIHDILSEKKENNDQSFTEIVIIGGGPNGVEIAGELAVHTKDMARLHKLDPNKIRITLIEALDRILFNIPAEESKKVHKHLTKLGVEVKTNTKVEKALDTGLVVNNETVVTKTVIWTAGTKGHHLYSEWGFPINEKGKVLVDEYLQSSPSIFVAGDNANAQGAGTAWPAIDHGEIAAENIANLIQNQSLEKYQPKEYPFIVPVGPNWAIAKFKNFTFWGIDGWIAREIAILKFLIKLTSPKDALEIFRSAHDICLTCQTNSNSLAQNEQTQYKLE